MWLSCVISIAMTRMPCLPAFSKTHGRQPFPWPWKAYGFVRGLYAPMRVVVWPKEASAANIASAFSGVSTAQSPAKTCRLSCENSTPLYVKPLARRSSLCRPMTRYSCDTRTTRSTPGRTATSSTARRCVSPMR